MQYLIFHNGCAFYTKWFDAENHFVKGMVVFDLITHNFTRDGKDWLPIEEDHL